MVKYLLVSCLILICSLLICSSCGDNISPNKKPPVDKIDSLHFITHNYIELDKIEKISKFRSGIGHDYWDDFENCRSMKHYFLPYDSLDWSKIKIFAPVTGKIVKVVDEGRGFQINIEPDNLSYYNVIIFHINLIEQFKEGDMVSSGQLLGTHFSNETYSDIAISLSTSDKYRLISYFDVLPGSLFAQYQARGVNLSSDLIISKEARDADPLNCNGKIFGTEGTLDNWFMLK